MSKSKFFNDKTYRKAKIRVWKLRFCSLPLIKHAIMCGYAVHVTKRIINLESWERSEKGKEIEYEFNKKTLIWNLIKLEATMFAKKGRNKKKKFLKCRQELLKNALMKEEKLQEFKEWLEQATLYEEDFAKVEAVIESFSTKNGN